LAPRSGDRNLHRPGRLGDVWDEREELFEVGADSDEEDGEPPHHHSGGPATPAIIVTRSDS